MAVALAILLALWAIQTRPAWPGPAPMLRGLGVLAGAAGTALLACALALGLRWRALERVFRGLDKLHRIHHEVGAVAFLLLLAHPLLLAAGVAIHAPAGAARLLYPFPGSTGLLLGWMAILLLLLVVPLSFVQRLPHRAWHWLHLLSWPALGLGLLHGIQLRGRPLVFDLVLAAIAVASLGIRLALLLSPRSRHEYAVVEARRLSPEVSELALQARGRALRFHPGQFVYIRFHDPRTGWKCTEYHPFTLSSSPSRDTLRVTIKALGDCTCKLVRLGPGTRARIQGPFGRLLAGPPPARQIWLAGGMGVTPFLGAARALADAAPAPGEAPDHAAAPPAPIDLYYCVDTEQEAHHLDELQDIARRTGALRVLPHIAAHEGFLSADRIARDSGDLDTAEYYLAGPPAFLTALRRALEARGVRAAHIHDERFS